MRSDIPMTLGVLSLTTATLGCSPAYAVASAFEKVCKANCECGNEEYGYGFDSVKNCKKHCAGYALILEASFLERDEEPCGDIKQIAKDLKKCAKKSCGEARYECIDEAQAELYECWPYDDYEPYEYDGVEKETMAVERDIDEAELTSRMLYGAFADDAGEASLAE